jgi:peptidoglycan glycosyltransferase
VGVSSGEILALLSLPIYDPNTLDADWQQLQSDPAAPLLNRATQGLYQPGGVIQLAVLAAALEVEAVKLDALSSDPDIPVMIDGQSLGCAHVPSGSTLAEAVAAACPAPLADVGQALGAEFLETVFRTWAFHTPPLLEIPAEAGEVQVTDPRMAAIGQERLTVTPLRIAMVAATIGNRGVMPPARLMLRSEDSDGMWQLSSPKGKALAVIGADLSNLLLTLLRPFADGRVLGHSSFALAGADQPFHVWFFGLAPAQAPRYAVAVLLEHTGADGLAVVEQIGQDALLTALTRAQ